MRPADTCQMDRLRVEVVELGFYRLADSDERVKWICGGGISKT